MLVFPECDVLNKPYRHTLIQLILGSLARILEHDTKTWLQNLPRLVSDEQPIGSDSRHVAWFCVFVFLVSHVWREPNYERVDYHQRQFCYQ